MGKREGIMLCYPFEEKRLAKWKPPYLVQPKLDGERCRAVATSDGEYHLISSELNEFISVPHINLALRATGRWPAELDGELYVHGWTFDQIHSVVSRTVNPHPDALEMQYHIFDIVSPDPQHYRITGSFNNNSLQAVPTYIADSLEGVMKHYDSILKDGYEGIVVRHIDNKYIRRRSIYVMKFKPKKDDYYKIVGFKEEISIHGEPKGILGSFICESNGETFRAGGLKEKEKVKYWGMRDELLGKLLHVKYQNITSKRGVPRFGVAKEVVDDEPKEVKIGGR